MNVGNLFSDLLKLLYGVVLLFAMAHVGGVAVQLWLLDFESYVARVEFPAVPEEVKRSMAKKHGTLFLDWNDKLREFGYWRGEQWCSMK